MRAASVGYTAELAARGYRMWELGRLTVPEYLALIDDIKQERWNASHG